MKIEKMKVTELIPADYNPRKDLMPGDKEYEKLKQSVERFGFVEPIIYNERSGRVVGGHQRLKVIRDLGWESIEVSVVDLGEEDEKALNVALNKIEGDWDRSKLKELLEDLESSAYDLDFTGFDTDEIEELMAEFTDVEEVQEDDFDVQNATDEARKNTKSRRGGDLAIRKP